jgi:hypothetical protein
MNMEVPMRRFRACFLVGLTRPALSRLLVGLLLTVGTERKVTAVPPALERTSAVVRAQDEVPRAPVSGPEQHRKSANPKPASPETADERDLPALEEILRLRRLVGDPFQGTILESAGDPDEAGTSEQFAGALRAIVQQMESNEGERLEGRAEREAARRSGHTRCEEEYEALVRGDDAGPVHPLPRAAGGREYPLQLWSRHAPGTVVEPPVASHPVGLGGAPADSTPARLRLMARRIGGTADDLEDLGRYEEADELRGVADRLRLAARGSDESH